MTGNWEGSYQFDHNGLKVKTSLDIIIFKANLNALDGENFNGTIVDYIGNSGIKDSWNIFGYSKGEKIFFQKFKSATPVKNKMELEQLSDRQSPIIYYHGDWSVGRRQVAGLWKFKTTMKLFLGFIPVPYNRGKGKWSMIFTDL